MSVNTLKPAPTTVAHIKHVPSWWKVDAHFVYIGREKSGMHYGNPFSSKSKNIAKVRVDSREESVEAFRLWITGEAYQNVEPERRDWILANLHKLRGNTLVCFCHPDPCHGHILAKLADE